MKRLLQAMLLVVACPLLATGCSSVSAPEEPVAGMMKTLYFADGSYDNYKAFFERPDHVISADEFNKIRSGTSHSVFGEKSFEDLQKQMRAFQKDDTNAAVYWADFANDKSKDLHWYVVKTDAGWKIKN